MKNTLVSSRIPEYKKELAKSILESIGATTSDLINSAFDYLIETHELPSAAFDEEDAPSLSAESVAAEIYKMTLGNFGEAQHDFLADPYYRHQLREGKAADYEALA